MASTINTTLDLDHTCVIDMDIRCISNFLFFVALDFPHTSFATKALRNVTIGYINDRILFLFDSDIYYGTEKRQNELVGDVTMHYSA